MKENKGITLIALVITIIVLLILAGVSIAMLSGENSILKNAQTARDESAKGTLDEITKLAVGGIITDYRGWPGAAGSTYTDGTNAIADQAKIVELVTTGVEAIAGSATFDADSLTVAAESTNGVKVSAKVNGKEQVVYVSVATGAVTLTAPTA